MKIIIINQLKKIGKFLFINFLFGSQLINILTKMGRPITIIMTNEVEDHFKCRTLMSC